jgi:hypothetical protein
LLSGDARPTNGMRTPLFPGLLADYVRSLLNRRP